MAVTFVGYENVPETGQTGDYDPFRMVVPPAHQSGDLLVAALGFPTIFQWFDQKSTQDYRKFSIQGGGWNFFGRTQVPYPLADEWLSWVIAYHSIFDVEWWWRIATGSEPVEYLADILDVGGGGIPWPLPFPYLLPAVAYGGVYAFRGADPADPVSSWGTQNDEQAEVFEVFQPPAANGSQHGIPAYPVPKDGSMAAFMLASMNEDHTLLDGTSLDYRLVPLRVGQTSADHAVRFGYKAVNAPDSGTIRLQLSGGNCDCYKGYGVLIKPDEIEAQSAMDGTSIVTPGDPDLFLGPIASCDGTSIVTVDALVDAVGVAVPDRIDGTSIVGVRTEAAIGPSIRGTGLVGVILVRFIGDRTPGGPFAPNIPLTDPFYIPPPNLSALYDLVDPRVATELRRYVDDLRRGTADERRILREATNYAGSLRSETDIVYRYDDDAEGFLSLTRFYMRSPAESVLAFRKARLVRWDAQWTTPTTGGENFNLGVAGSIWSYTAGVGETSFSLLYPDNGSAGAPYAPEGSKLEFFLTPPYDTELVTLAEFAWQEEFDK